MKSFSEKQKEVYTSLQKDFGLKNPMQTPCIEKIIVNVGTGSAQKKDKHKNEFIAGELAKITGQKPAPRPSKFSIAGFKVRQGDIIGQSVTLRGEKMESFFDKLIHVALPRTKDFRGIDTRNIDTVGNLTIGIKEHTIFPETGDEDLQNVFGLSVTIVTSLPKKEQAEIYLRFLGFPFKKAS